MNPSVKQTIITVVATIAISISGGWMAGSNTQAEQGVKINNIDSQLKKGLIGLQDLTVQEAAAETRITKLEVQANTAYYQIGRIDNRLEKFDERIQSVQVSSVEIAAAIKQFTSVVRDLSIQTDKMSDVVSRLDERVANLKQEVKKKEIR